MKTKSYLIALAIMFVVIGCKEKTDLVKMSSDETNYFSLSDEVKACVNSGTPEAIKQSYLLLNHKDQQALWLAKLNTILKNDADKLSEEQKNIVLSIKQFMSNYEIEKLFKNPMKGDIFLKNNLSYFEKHFTSEQLYLLIECAYFDETFSLFKAKDYVTTFNSLRAPDPAGASGNCTCFYSLSCSFLGLNSQCHSGSCTKKYGCGIFGTSNCNGLCW